MCKRGCTIYWQKIWGFQRDISWPAQVAMQLLIDLNEKMLESMRGSAHDVWQKGWCFKTGDLQIQEEEDIMLPECLTKQKLANYIALSALSEGVHGKGIKNLGAIEAAVKQAWLLRQLDPPECRLWEQNLQHPLHQVCKNCVCHKCVYPL